MATRLYVCRYLPQDLGATRRYGHKAHLSPTLPLPRAGWWSRSGGSPGPSSKHSQQPSLPSPPVSNSPATPGCMMVTVGKLAMSFVVIRCVQGLIKILIFKYYNLIKILKLEGGVSRIFHWITFTIQRKIGILLKYKTNSVSVTGKLLRLARKFKGHSLNSTFIVGTRVGNIQRKLNKIEVIYFEGEARGTRREALQGRYHQRQEAHPQWFR